MPAKSPKISEIENQGISRLKQLEPQIDASWYGKFALNLVRAFAGAVYLVCLYSLNLFKASFVQLAKGDDLDLHARENNLVRKPAAGATGYVAVYGEPDTLIPLSTPMTGNNGYVYSTDEEAYILQKSYTVTEITPSDDLVWLKIGAHGLTTDGPVALSGFLPDSLNADYSLAGVSKDSVCIDVGGVAIETMGIVSANLANLGVTCDSTGIETNMGGGEPLTCKVDGVESAIVQVDGLSGGADVESDYYLRQRIQKARSIIEGVFTAPQVELAALNVSGNTRSWVVGPEYGVVSGERGQPGYRPRPGEVVVYVVRDDDSDIRPSETVLSLTKDQVVLNGKMPCHTRTEDIFVLAPIVQAVDITLSNLVPDTPEMRKAVTSEYQANIADLLTLGSGLTRKQIEQSILSAQDTAGNRVVNFDLVSPSADVSGQSGTLLIAGEVTWA